MAITYMDPIFSGIAAVEIQGPRVLEFVSLDENQAEFDVIGISKPRIRIIDHRPAVKRSMRSILKSGRVEELSNYFNKPARVTLFSEKKDCIIVRLEKTRTKRPQHMLWIAIGVGENIPYYEYKAIELQQMNENNYALFSLYKRP